MEFLALHVGKGFRVTQLNCQSFKVTKCNISVPFDFGSRVLFHRMFFSPGSPKVGNFIQEDTNWEAFAHHLFSSSGIYRVPWKLQVMNLLKLPSFTNGSSSEILKHITPLVWLSTKGWDYQCNWPNQWHSKGHTREMSVQILGISTCVTLPQNWYSPWKEAIPKGKYIKPVFQP